MAFHKVNPKELHLLHEGINHDEEDDLFFSSSSLSSSSSGEEEQELEEEEEEIVATAPSNQRRRPSRRMIGRDKLVDRAWQMRRSGSPSSDIGCRLLVRPSGSFGSRHVSMDIDEVRACKDLGLEFPHDWSLELSPSSPSFSSSPRSSGTSPASSLRISSPGDDPREVKERLKAWAHAVALASASSSFRSSG